MIPLDPTARPVRWGNAFNNGAVRMLCEHEPEGVTVTLSGSGRVTWDTILRVVAYSDSKFGSPPA